MPAGLTLPAAGPAALFALAVLLATISGVVASGHLPVGRRPGGPRLSVGLLLLAALGVAGAALYMAVGGLPWYAVVIIGGLALLGGPLCEQALPPALRARAGGLLVLAALDAGTAAACLASAA